MAPHFRKLFVTLSLILVLITTSACGAVSQTDRTSYAPRDNTAIGSGQVEHGDTKTSQAFGDWVVKTGRGLVQDAYVRGGDKLGVVVASKVRPDEVKPLARSLVQGFHRQAPNRDLTVLMYAPDKKLILTAKYNNSTNEINYQAS
jgi:predicted metallo-beta-lactamase superfamily hydrolase